MISYPFTSQVTYDEINDPGHLSPIFDRAVDSAILRQLDKQDYTDGVAINPSTCFKVMLGTGMTVTVGAGSGRVQGTKFYEQDDRVLQVQASESLDRIDTVVIRLNDNTEFRNVDLYVVKGTAATNPIPPTLTRTGGVYELGVANIFISKNTTTITQERITDTRQDAEKCGYSMPIQTVDTTALYNQYEDAMDDILEGYQNAIDGTTAGILSGRIDDADSKIFTLETETQPILRGGTGATTKSAARASLEVPYYEEGTWTPRLEKWDGSLLYTGTGKYRRTGNIVYCAGEINLTSKDLGSSALIRVTNFPYIGNSSTGISNFAQSTIHSTSGTLGITTILGSIGILKLIQTGFYGTSHVVFGEVLRFNFVLYI